MAENIPSFHSILLEFFEVCLQIHQLESQTDQQIQTLIASRNFSSESIDAINLNFEEAFEKHKDRGGFLLHQLFFLSERENFYFFDCPLKVYRNHYNKRKQVFMNENLDAKEKDFIHCELKNLKHPGCKRILEFPIKTMCKACSKHKRSEPQSTKLCKKIGNGSGLLFLNNQTVLVNYARLIPPLAPWKYSTARKIAFLEHKLEKLKAKKKVPVLEPATAQPQLTTNQSIILLNQLGVFANPIMESQSKVKQAQIIGQLINRNAKNVKTAIEKLENSLNTNGLNYKNDLNLIKDLIQN